MKRLLTAAVLSLGLLLPAMPVSAAEAPAKAVCENEKLRLWYDGDTTWKEVHFNGLSKQSTSPCLKSYTFAINPPTASLCP